MRQTRWLRGKIFVSTALLNRVRAASVLALNSQPGEDQLCPFIDIEVHWPFRIKTGQGSLVVGRKNRDAP